MEIIHNNAEEQKLMKYLMALIRDGNDVSIHENGVYDHSLLAKDTQVHTTKSESDAIAWSLQKIHEGYNVTYGHDSTTGEYTCIAIR